MLCALCSVLCVLRRRTHDLVYVCVCARLNVCAWVCSFDCGVCVYLCVHVCEGISSHHFTHTHIQPAPILSPPLLSLS